LPPAPARGSLQSRGPLDERLPAGERVLGVNLGKKQRAYREADLVKSPLLSDTPDGVGVVVLWNPATKTASAYRPRCSGKAATAVDLEHDPKSPRAPFRDRSTKSLFDYTGRCVEGKLAGQTLEWLDGVQVKWYAWAAEHPGTAIHGKK